MIGRRSFLRALGISSVSGPIAAKTAIEAEAAQLTSLAGYAVAPLSVGYTHMRGDEQRTQNFLKMASYIKTHGTIPEFVEKRLREYAKHVPHLDADIAAKRSWSLNYKIMVQRQRNYEKEVERLKEGSSFEVLQSQFMKMLGFTWEF